MVLESVVEGRDPQEGDPNHFMSEEVVEAAMTPTIVDELGEEAETHPHAVTFEQKPWRIPEPVAKWYEYNVLERRGQDRRPTCLVLVGMPRSGKSRWAWSWGRPAGVIDLWKVEEIEKLDCTHLVLDDIQWAGLSRESKRSVAACEIYVSVDHRVWKPVIITCNEEDSPMADPVMKSWLAEFGATVVDLGRQRLYGDSDVNKEQGECKN